MPLARASPGQGQVQGRATKAWVRAGPGRKARAGSGKGRQGQGQGHRAMARVSSVQFRSSQVKSSQVKSGQVRSGQVRSGQVRSGQVRSGQVKSGQVKSGQVKSGQVRSGQVSHSSASLHGMSFGACSPGKALPWQCLPGMSQFPGTHGLVRGIPCAGSTFPGAGLPYRLWHCWGGHCWARLPAAGPPVAELAQLSADPVVNRTVPMGLALFTDSIALVSR